MSARARVAVAIAFLSAAAVASSAPASTRGAQAACGTIVGPAWSVPAFSKKGNAWRVSATAVPCAFAKTWAAKLVRTPNRGEAGTVLHGPAGWHCLPSVTPSRGTSGRCAKGRASFAWVIASS